jgi:hypothetical protein
MENIHENLITIIYTDSDFWDNLKQIIIWKKRYFKRVTLLNGVNVIKGGKRDFVKTNVM